MIFRNFVPLSSLLLTTSLAIFALPPARAEGEPPSGGPGTENQPVTPSEAEKKNCGEEGSGKSRSFMSSSFVSISAGLSALAPDMAEPSVVGLRASNVGAHLTTRARSSSARSHFPGGISAYYATPESLTPFGKGGEILRSSEGWVRQIKTETGFLNVEKISNGYCITGYMTSDLSDKKNAEGLYTLKPGAAPLSRRTVIAQNGGSKMRVEETTWYGKTPRKEIVIMEQKPGEKPDTAVLSQIWSNHNGEYKRSSTTLSLVPSSAKNRSAFAAPPVEHYINEVEELGTDGNYYVVKRTAGTRTTYRWDKGEVPLVENSAVDANGTPLPENIVSCWTYYTNPADRSSYGRPASLRKSNGYWEDYSYSDNHMAGVKITRTTSPWMNTPAPEPGQKPEGDYRLKQEVSLTTDTGTSGTTVTVNGVPIEKEWTESIAVGENTIMETRHQPHSGGDKITVTKRYCRDKAKVAESLLGKPLLIKNADGSLETYAYTLDDDTLTTIKNSGYGTGDTVIKGLRTIIKENRSTGKLKEEIRYALEDGQAYWLGSKTGVDFDPLGNCLKWVYDNNSEDYTEQRRDCCQINWERTRDGVETTYTRNADGKLISEFSRGIIRTWERKGLTISEWKQAEGDQQRYLVKEITVDMSGNVLTEKIPVAGGRTVSTSYLYNIPERSTVTTSPAGTTEIKTSYADKQLAKTVSDSGLVTRYTYSPNVSSGEGVITISRENDVDTSVETDLLSHETRLVAGNGAVTRHAYTPAGQLLKTSLPDGESQLYQYTADGTVISGLDMDGDNVLTTFGDRMSRTTKSFDPSWPQDRGSWKTDRQMAWKGNWISQGVQWDTADGTLTRSKTQGVSGYVVEQKPALFLRKKSYTEVKTEADGQVRETAYTLDKGNVLFKSMKWRDSNGRVITTNDTSYDIWGNPIAQSDARQGTTLFSYDRGTGVLLETTSPAQLTTSFLYDDFGRQVTVILPDGLRQHISYDQWGRIVRQWGSLLYPVLFEYNVYGQKTGMTTYRAPVSESASWPDGAAGDKTLWEYDSVTGLLLKKNDAEGKGTIYSYTPGGKLKTETNARGLVKEYTYDKAGQIVSMEVNDQGKTPVQTCSYDQWGRPVLIETAGVLSCQDVYNDQNQVMSEQWNIPTQNGDFIRKIERRYDLYGRPVGYQLKHGEDVEQSVSYTYNPAGKPACIIADGKTFSYEYVNNAPQLVSGMTSPIHTVINTWEEARDMLSNKTNAWKNKTGTQVISNYTYTLNNLGQRTAVSTSGESFAQSPADWIWSYDILGQIAQANNDYYTYDQIGNRTAAGKENSPRTTYVANALNQYATVNALSPAYDADGNLLTGLIPSLSHPDRTDLSFTWNADNRPVEVRLKGVLKELRTYDHQGRRIRKGELITLYDGYNAIARYDLNTHTLKKTFAWGSDLSGSLESSGGAGGLLSVTEYDGQMPLVSYPCYDGNGNVTEYLTEENSGRLAAHYEYDAFGNVIGKTGEREYDYQFSTKPFDELAGLLYYNYRDYDPQSGRWLGRDPLEEKGGSNLYVFIRNCFFATDVLGLICDDECSPGLPKDVKIDQRTYSATHSPYNKNPEDDIKTILKKGECARLVAEKAAEKNLPARIICKYANKAGEAISDGLGNLDNRITRNSAAFRVVIKIKGKCCKCSSCLLFMSRYSFEDIESEWMEIPAPKSVPYGFWPWEIKSAIEAFVEEKHPEFCN